MKPKPRLKPLRASEVVRWVLKHQDAYPLSEHYDSLIENDMAVGVCFEEERWCSCTPTWFARYCGVSLSVVRLWLMCGMPLRADGRLNLGPATRWLDDHEQGWQEPAARQVELQSDQYRFEESLFGSQRNFFKAIPRPEVRVKSASKTELGPVQLGAIRASQRRNAEPQAPTS